MTLTDSIPLAEVRPDSPYLAYGDGTALPLDADELRLIINALAEQDEMITTGEAAKILHVSPRTVARIVDAGEIPSVRYGRLGNRMVSKRDVLAFLDKSSQRTSEGLDSMRTATYQGGLDELDGAAYIARFN